MKNIYQSNSKNCVTERNIKYQLTIPSKSQQNDIAKRRNRILLEIVKSIMTEDNLLITC